LANGFARISASGNVQQALVRLGILNDSGGFAVHRENYRALALFEVLDKIAGATAEGTY